MDNTNTQPNTPQVAPAAPNPSNQEVAGAPKEPVATNTQTTTNTAVPSAQPEPVPNTPPAQPQESLQAAPVEGQVGSGTQPTREQEGVTGPDGKNSIFTFDAVLTTGKVTGDGMRIDLASMNTSDFQKRPVMLFSHDSAKPIGQFSGLRRTQRGLEAKGDIYAGGGNTAIDAARLIQSDLMTGVSIGISYSWDQMTTEMQNGKKVYVINNSTLQEASVVAIPRDKDADIRKRANANSSLIVNEQGFATFGQDVKIIADAKGMCTTRFCLPIAKEEGGITQEERELQEKKDAGVVPPETQTKTFSVSYGEGLTTKQEQEKELLVSGGIPPEQAEGIVQEEAKKVNMSQETKTTPPPTQVLQAGNIPQPQPSFTDPGDLNSGSDVQEFLGVKIDVGKPTENVMRKFFGAIADATNKGKFNGRAFTNYGQALKFVPGLKEQEDNVLLALERRDNKVTLKKKENNEKILFERGLNVRVRYQ